MRDGDEDGDDQRILIRELSQSLDRQRRAQADEVHWGVGIQATIDWSMDREEVKEQTKKAVAFLG